MWGGMGGGQNTGCPFYCVPEHGSCYRMAWWMQAYCAVKLPYTGALLTGLYIHIPTNKSHAAQSFLKQFIAMFTRAYHLLLS